jgi:hypothetical protein
MWRGFFLAAESFLVKMAAVPLPPPLADLLSQAQNQLTELSRSFDSAVAAEVEAQKPRIRRELSEALNQSMRRLRDAASSGDWARALLDATGIFCRRAALFSVTENKVRPLGGREFNLAPSSEIPLASIPAFVSVVESKDPVVVIRSPREFSDRLLEALGPSEARRAHLFPVSNGRAVIAVLYVEEDESGADAAGLEMLAALAGLAMEHRVAVRRSGAPGLVALEGGKAEGRVARKWSELTREERELHLKAQRFASVKVAEMRLYKSDEVKAARAGQDLYGALRDDIDRARTEYQDKFMTKTPTMFDYLHLELLTTLANDEIAAFGKDYPGPLV